MEQNDDRSCGDRVEIGKEVTGTGWGETGMVFMGMVGDGAFNCCPRTDL